MWPYKTGGLSSEVPFSAGSTEYYFLEITQNAYYCSITHTWTFCYFFIAIYMFLLVLFPLIDLITHLAFTQLVLYYR